ncbi:uncharacterized protein CTRU02_214804 [Colletotrichum truncatum]|uniref:Uncharacterized protein n=2 Tax=Colletotrichum truncatum TaxID=5467 RepID=A0ACC3YDT8_COLTU|nr:uncharacterized protein CTRU02_13934 [Colletotrichum truncatum]XP_036582361.1 uncharacterized protein CTRU02_07405 [Colletotrichum truncatum]KAF6782777.1 hypothetical protein CTRU02_13934 [Colletotrichum truncatum]KAF6791065.1 hypothetical protein CTRU02_07405 [Colletotrichum truncatum]
MAFRFVMLCLAAVVVASPVFTPRAMNGTAFDPERGLLNGEVLLVDGDHMEVVNQEAYFAMLASEKILASVPEVDHSLLSFKTPSEEEVNNLDSRQIDCDDIHAITITKTEQFYDWDLQMSPVVIAQAKEVTISLTETYTVTDTITINGGFNPTIIQSYLTSTLGVAVSRSWATASAIMVRGTISAGHTGCMVNNPFKTRRYGKIMRGCLGRQTQVGAFMSDVYEEGSYNGVKWVKGAITNCEKEGVHRPLTRCQGSGEFV